MNILKHGKMDAEKDIVEEFECKKCGCKFSVVKDEYYVEKGQEFSRTDSLVYIYSSVVTDTYVCSCPECHKIVTKTKQRTVENPCITVTKNVLDTSDNILDACKRCSNHPSNGGSGNCNCILGMAKSSVTC